MNISGDFSLEKEGVLVEKKEKTESYAKTFSETGTVEIAVRPHSPGSCVGNLSLTLHILNEMILYVGERNSEVIDQELVSLFESKSVLFDAVFLE